MTHLRVNKDLFSTLKDKVVVITGGATGIGKAAVTQFALHGAKVVFGDVNEQLSEELVSELGPNVTFKKCNAASYDDQLALFAQSDKLHGRVDIVVANAGVVTVEDMFGPKSDWSRKPDMKEIEVNLEGVMYTTRIGLAYLRKTGGGDVVLTSSIAGFKESGGLASYTASKHGVIGIIRGLNLTAIREGIRVNAVCPWMTKTPMAKWFQESWINQGLPSNEPEDVADAILICATANRGKEGQSHEGAALPFAGKIIWVGGGESYEIEDRIQALESQWLGEENSRVLVKGQEFLAKNGGYA
ncbi:putative 15-hydroxyprostaglandin dehydrogenase [Exophiala viscosa]|uniref:15-hydroxyprostaglandin dehydrogenase n=1 Tax=Exophiala viscosa TaxID=2486360 RepID=A0AAN6I923_9EURO|nr:putative 15-hydroxyprostaglandin dehydrogenase [Exophiala viscosa]